ncbi:hypothetical protein Q1695_011275 [Nippostrongylus brasiliensis]|nr:hypothetical protein Q1695_011275 [Nippostrongylus brasiliensis]
MSAVDDEDFPLTLIRTIWDERNDSEEVSRASSFQYTNAMHVSHVSDCGKVRGCWLLPNGCKDSSDCTGIITWQHTGRSLLFELEIDMKMKPNGVWVGLGISKDDLMGNDTVLECQFRDKGQGSVHLSHNTKDKNLPLPEATQILLKDSYTEVRDDRMLCGAEWMLDAMMLHPDEKRMMHRISAGKYHLLLAFGELGKDSEKKQHELIGEGAPWRSNGKARFCSHCPPEIVDE